MLLQMMISMVDVSLPKNVFFRYVLIGLLNLTIFYGLYEFCFFLTKSWDYGPNVSWAVAWVLGSIFAHLTHRKWTFYTDESVKWTLSASLTIYTIGLIGSSGTFGLFVNFWGFNHRISWAVNSAIWGIIDYIGLHKIAFKHQTDSKSI